MKKYVLKMMFILFALHSNCKAFSFDEEKYLKSGKKSIPITISDSDQKKFFSSLERRAKKGNAKVQYILARKYLKGEGTPIDFDKAVYWYTLSADQNYAPAQCALGIMYQSTKYNRKNTDKACQLWEKAAAQNHAHAFYLLSRYCFIYEKEDVNFKEKFLTLVEKAISLKSAEACLSLAFLYRQGDFFEKDNIKAIPLLKRISKKGYYEADCILGDIYSEDTGNTQSISKAIKYYERSADAGYSNAFFRLGFVYAEGFIVPKDRQKAKKYLKIASENLVEAHYVLAHIYILNALDADPYILDKNPSLRHENKDYCRAKEWLKLPVERKMVDAIKLLDILNISTDIDSSLDTPR